MRVILPFDVEEHFGGRGRMSVRGTLNDVPFRAMVQVGRDGTGHMWLDAALSGEAGAGPGDLVHVTMEVDPDPPVVEVPHDLRAALRADPEAGRIFEELPHSHRREFVDWIEEAKGKETRARRIANTLEMLPASRRPKG